MAPLRSTAALYFAATCVHGWAPAPPARHSLVRLAASTLDAPLEPAERARAERCLDLDTTAADISAQKVLQDWGFTVSAEQRVLRAAVGATAEAAADRDDADDQCDANLETVSADCVLQHWGLKEKMTPERSMRTSAPAMRPAAVAVAPPSAGGLDEVTDDNAVARVLARSKREPVLVLLGSAACDTYGAAEQALATARITSRSSRLPSSTLLCERCVLKADIARNAQTLLPQLAVDGPFASVHPLAKSLPLCVLFADGHAVGVHQLDLESGGANAAALDALRAWLGGTLHVHDVAQQRRAAARAAADGAPPRKSAAPRLPRSRFDLHAALGELRA